MLTFDNGVLGVLPIIFGIYLKEARGDSWCKVLNLALEFNDGGNKQWNLLCIKICMLPYMAWEHLIPNL